jgi:tetratricopeptide (TPR) repeat protein
VSTEETKGTEKHRQGPAVGSGAEADAGRERPSAEPAEAGASPEDDAGKDDSSHGEPSRDDPRTDGVGEDDAGEPPRTSAVVVAGSDAAARAGEPTRATAGSRASADSKKRAAGSAGARLAAAKAAKAAKKAAKKKMIAAAGGLPSGMTGGGPGAAEPIEALKESAIGQAAAKAGRWAQSNRPLAYGIAAALAIALLGGLGWSWWQAIEAERAGAALAEAVRIANAEVRAQGDQRPDGDDAPSFETPQARAEAALDAFRRVVTEHGGTEAARWAQLGAARALFDLGRFDDAREAYEVALRHSGRDPMIAWRALEGIGFTYEAEGELQAAIERYEELRRIDDGAYAVAADYHIARLRMAMGQRLEATNQLRTLIEQIRSDAETSEPAFPYVLAQAELRLRELDPGASSEGGASRRIGPRGGGSTGVSEGLEGIPPEILEQLRRQLDEGGDEGGGE